MIRFAAALLAASLAVSGCASDDALTGRQLPFFSRGTTPQQVESAARYQALIAAGHPQMLGVIESRELGAPLVLSHRTADGVEVWISGDGVMIALKDGLLVATRGLAPDLMSADAAQSARLLSARRDGAAELFHSRLDGEDRTVTSAYICDLQDIQYFALDLGSRVVPTRYMIQTCHGLHEDFTNYFWVDTRTGDIRQSRQQVTPELGLLALRQVLP